MTFPENFKVVSGCTATTTNAAVTGDYISLKNAHKVWVKFKFTQAASHATVCSIYKATAVAPTGGVVCSTESFKNWYNQDTSTTDALTKGTDATTVTLAAGTTNQVVIIEVDPAQLGATYDCIAGYTSASSESTNFVDIDYIIDTRYPAGTPPTAITD